MHLQLDCLEGYKKIRRFLVLGYNLDTGNKHQQENLMKRKS